MGWTDKLKQWLEDRAVQEAIGGEGLNQSRIFEQYTRVLQALAEQRVLLLVLDDLQWVDTGSISLLFHLSRRIRENRCLVIGTYREVDVAMGRAGPSTGFSTGPGQRERHPLASALNEFKRYFGDIWVDLEETEEAEGRQFIDALLDTEPNRLDEGFREALFRHTSGHPLFTVELLRDMQQRSDLVRDNGGSLIEGPTLDWDTLPARVEGVIEGRIARLDPELRDVLLCASAEGEEFTAQVVAQVRNLNERQLAGRLGQELDKQHHLVVEQGVERVGGNRLFRWRFRHALFQDYLYQNLSDMERMMLHEDVGRCLEELYSIPTWLLAEGEQHVAGDESIRTKTSRALDQSARLVLDLPLAKA